MPKLEYKHWYLLGILPFIVLTNLSVVLDIPYIRFIFGFCFLTILPGFLILPIIDIQRINFLEKCLLIVGISIGFILFYGLAINIILMSMGYMLPLSTNSILITFDILYIILILLGSKNQYYKVNTCSFLQFSPIEKSILIFLFVIPTAIFISVCILNVQENNVPLLGSLLLVPVYLLFLTVHRDRVNSNIFPFSLLVLSFSLLSLFMLRYQFIWGVDIQREYGLFFLTTYDNLCWTYLGGNLGTALSITLLPTVIYSICQIDHVELLFKFIYVFVCSFSPVAIYYTIKRYFDPFLAFCATLYFIFQSGYLHAAGSPRTNIAVFFCALTLYLLIDNDIEKKLKKTLILLFIAAIIVSHYATAYIFFFILIVGVLIINSIHGLKSRSNYIDYSIILFYFVLIISWTFFLFKGHALTSGIEIIIDSLLEFLTDNGPNLQTTEAKMTFNPEFKNGYLTAAHWITVWSSFLFIGLGTLYSLTSYIQKQLHLWSVGREAPDTRLPEIGIEYIIFGVISAILLGLFISLKSISNSYDSPRLFSLTAIVLSPFLIVGIMYIVRCIVKMRGSLSKTYFDINRIAGYCVIILIISYSLFTLGLPYQIAGIQQSHLSQDSIDYMQVNIYEGEKFAAIWLKEKHDKNTNILRPKSGLKELWSAGRFPLNSLNTRDHNDSYIYFGNFEISDGFYDNYIITNFLHEQHKLFSNQRADILYDVQ
ncbi:DUF2206 domain-containing protein [Methanofollis fontis]|uniref:DUF2206 domain-containing protein n=1 Tax=Methanofollis fontis TaxID=2052832 RepID=A0A483CX60_9EURY|nr:DUF2206 domain-containing protein [Methanofollis fontis]TAJ43692.1 hypothetical protein CUJ86_10175 [Methanofollis fontis]